MNPAYQYKARIMRWVDADTVDLDVDLGFYTHLVSLRFRLAGIDAPERFTDAGKLASAFVNENWPAGSNVIIKSHKDGADKYGRWLAYVFPELATNSVNESLVTEGHAVYKEY